MANINSARVFMGAAAKRVIFS
ncbi:hypothetical protein LINPERHAP2_LOCUS41802 [Linum perenne]